MVRRHIVRPLLLVVALAAAAPLTACYVQTRAAVVVDAPPPRVRRVQVEPRPGYLWVDGHWISRGGRWVWRDGHWVRSRPDHAYVQGRWIKRSGRWHWVEPRWERRSARERRQVREGREPVRDHRGGRR
jgi:hypothetical protein